MIFVDIVNIVCKSAARVKSLLRIDSLHFDDDNLDKLWHRGISAKRADAVLRGSPIFLKNKKGRRGAYKMVGPDDGGAMVTIVVAPTTEPGCWYPITGWESTKDEEGKWRRQHGYTG